jgi:hypothetical protein
MMGPRQIIASVKQIFPTVMMALLAVAAAAAALWLLPNRTAAVILGVLAGISLIYLVLRYWQRTAQIAVFWLSMGVIADAAYAKLNDVVPVTVANLLIQLAQAVVKLTDILIRSLGISGPDIREKMTAVTPDFVWALILTTALLTGIRLARREQNSNARPELRRAA